MKSCVKVGAALGLQDCRGGEEKDIYLTLDFDSCEARILSESNAEENGEDVYRAKVRYIVNPENNFVADIAVRPEKGRKAVAPFPLLRTEEDAPFCGIHSGGAPLRICLRQMPAYCSGMTCRSVAWAAVRVGD